MPTQLPKKNNYGIPPVAPAEPQHNPTPPETSTPANTSTVATVQVQMPTIEPRRRTEQFNVRIDGELHDRMKRYLARTGYTGRQVTEQLWAQFLNSMGEK